MATIEHDVSSSEEHQYKDHTMSERPEPTVEAGKPPDGQSEHSLEPQSQNDQLPISDGSARLENIKSMSPEGRREYATQLDIQFKDKSAQTSTVEQRLEVLKMKIEMQQLQTMIRKDEGEGPAPPAVPLVYLQHTKAAVMLRNQQREALQSIMPQNIPTSSNIDVPMYEGDLPPVHKYSSLNPYVLQLPKHLMSSEPQSVPVGHAHSHLSTIQQAQADTARLPSQVFPVDGIHTSSQSSSDARRKLKGLQSELKQLADANELRHKMRRQQEDVMMSSQSSSPTYQSPCQIPGGFINRTPPPYTRDPRLPAFMNHINANSRARQYQVQQMWLQTSHMRRSNPDRVERDNCSSCWENRKVQGYKCPHTPSSPPPWPPVNQLAPSQDDNAGSTAEANYFNPGAVDYSSARPTDPAVAAGNQAAVNHTALLMLLEHQNKKRLALARQEQDNMLSPESTTGPSNSTPAPASPFAIPADFIAPTQQLCTAQRQMIIPEQQSKEQAMLARQKQEINSAQPHDDIPGLLAQANYYNPGDMNPEGGNLALSDYQTQLMLLEQQNKKRLMLARQEQDSMLTPNQRTYTYPASGPPALASGFSIPELHVERGSLALRRAPPVPHCNIERFLEPSVLEQQNKNRLMMARQEQEINNPAPSHDDSTQLTTQADYYIPGIKGSGLSALRDYQAQLALAEQQNKDRQMKTRQDHDHDITMSELGSNLDLSKQSPTTAPASHITMSEAERDAMQKILGPPGQVLADYRKYLKSLEEQGKTNTVVRREQDILSSIDPESYNAYSAPSSSASTSQSNLGVDRSGILTDYQAYYMSPEQEHQSLMLARQKQDNTSSSDPKIYSAPLTSNSLPSSSASTSQSNLRVDKHILIAQEYNRRLITTRQQQDNPSSADPRSYPPLNNNPVPLLAASDYEPKPGVKPRTPADWQKKLMMLEQRNRERLMMARQEQENMLPSYAPKDSDPANNNPAPTPNSSTPASNADWNAIRLRQTHILQLEQQNKPSFVGLPRGQEKVPSKKGFGYPYCNSPAPPTLDHSPPDRNFSAGRPHALTDQQREIMLLEQRNRTNLKRLRQEDDMGMPPSDFKRYLNSSNSNSASSSATTSDSKFDVNEYATQISNSSSGALQDYQTQILLLEQRNKKRLMAARQEQGLTPTFPCPWTSEKQSPSNSTPSSVVSMSESKEFTEAKEALSRDEELSDYQRDLMKTNYHTHNMLVDQYKGRSVAKFEPPQQAQKDVPTSSPHPLPPTWHLLDPSKDQDLSENERQLMIANYNTYNMSSEQQECKTPSSHSWNSISLTGSESKDAKLSDLQWQTMAAEFHQHNLIPDEHGRRELARIRQAQENMPASSTHPTTPPRQSPSIASSSSCSSVVFTPESSASPQASDDEFNEGRPLAFRFAPQPPSSPL